MRASARDWARLGLLYLRDGVWDERRILPEGWVEFSRTPGPAENSGLHSAHWWVNGTPPEGTFSMLDPEIDAFMMSGNAGQYVILVPDRDLIVVRLGELHTLSRKDLKDKLSEIIEAFPMLQETAR